MLENGQIDLLTSAQKTPEREEKFAFSDEAIGTSSAILTVKSGDSRYTIGDYSTYSGMRVGLLMNSSRNKKFADFAAEKGFVYTPVYYSSVSGMTADLQKGRNIDAICSSNLRSIHGEWILDEFSPSDFYVMTFSGQNFGARRYERLNRVYGISILCNIVIGTALGGLTCLFAVPLLRIYLPEAPDALTAGAGRLFIIVAFDFICGCMNCTTNMLRGMGKSVFPMIATIVGCCGLRIVWIFTIFHSVFATGNKTDAYHALLISYPVSWLLSFAALFLFYVITKKKLDAQAA